MGIEAYLRAAALEVSPVAQLVLDAGGRAVAINGQARSLLGLDEDDLGRALKDLRVFHSPVDLRSVLDRVELERRTLVVENVEWRTRPGELRCLDVTITPVIGRDGPIQGMLLTFNDMTAFRRLERQLAQSHLELQSAYEAILSTNEELKAMNEELLSANHDLETINDEVRRR